MGRIISTESLDIEEQKSEYNLRPQYLSEYIGQKKVKDNLHIFIEAAKKRNATGSSASVWTAGTW